MFPFIPHYTHQADDTPVTITFTGGHRRAYPTLRAALVEAYLSGGNLGWSILRWKIESPLSVIRPLPAPVGELGVWLPKLTNPLVEAKDGAVEQDVFDRAFKNWVSEFDDGVRLYNLWDPKYAHNVMRTISRIDFFRIDTREKVHPDPFHWEPSPDAVLQSIRDRSYTVSGPTDFAEVMFATMKCELRDRLEAGLPFDATTDHDIFMKRLSAQWFLDNDPREIENRREREGYTSRSPANVHFASKWAAATGKTLEEMKQPYNDGRPVVFTYLNGVVKAYPNIQAGMIDSMANAGYLWRDNRQVRKFIAYNGGYSMAEWMRLAFFHKLKPEDNYLAIGEERERAFALQAFWGSKLQTVGLTGQRERDRAYRAAVMAMIRCVEYWETYQGENRPEYVHYSRESRTEEEKRVRRPALVWETDGPQELDLDMYLRSCERLPGHIFNYQRTDYGLEEPAERPQL